MIAIRERFFQSLCVFACFSQMDLYEPAKERTLLVILMCLAVFICKEINLYKRSLHMCRHRWIEMTNFI